MQNINKIENYFFSRYEKSKSFLFISFDCYLEMLTDFYTKTKRYIKLDQVLTLQKFYKDEEIC